mmetsp:Transcript_19405/g.3169  ORF Transcript_19405/g.3169 Transcript_19405/m.3169 type:complete len:102 (+) Transcript_19405:100-405(+)
MLSPYIVLFGGTTEAGLNNEVWVYSSGTNEYIKRSHFQDSVLPPSLQSYCVIEEVSDSLMFWIIFGKGAGEEALGSINKYDIIYDKWINVRLNDGALFKRG